MEMVINQMSIYVIVRVYLSPSKYQMTLGVY